MSLSKRFKKSVSIQSMNDDLKNSIEEFKSNCDGFNVCLERIEKYLNNSIDFIYDECSELKRIVQLDKEELITSIKESNNVDENLDDTKLDPTILAKIEKLSNEADRIIHEIHQYQNEAISQAKLDKEDHKKELKRDFYKLKEISKYFVAHWIEYLNDLKLVDTLKLSSAMTKLEDYKARLENLDHKLKQIAFSNRTLELKKYKETSLERLSYYVFYKEEVEFNRTKCCSKEFNRMIACVEDEYIMQDQAYDPFKKLFDMFPDGKFLSVVVEDFFSATLFTFDPSEKKIEKKKKLSNYLIRSVKIGEDSIFLLASGASRHYVLILNHDLELIAIRRVLTNFIFLSNSIRVHICELYQNGTLKVFDSSMNEILNTKYQSANKLEPFYLLKSDYQFEYRNQNYYFLDCYNYCLTIFDQGGYLFRRISFNFDPLYSFRIDLKGNIVLVDSENQRVNIHDLHGLPLKEINIVTREKRFDMSEMELLIDEKSRYILHDVEKNLFFVVNQ